MLPSRSVASRSCAEDAFCPPAEVARRPAEVVESAVDTYDNAAVRIDLVESRCRYEGETIAGRFRVCQTWVTVEGTPRLASVQYTSSAPS